MAGAFLVSLPVGSNEHIVELAFAFRRYLIRSANGDDSQTYRLDSIQVAEASKILWHGGDLDEPRLIALGDLLSGFRPIV